MFCPPGRSSNILATMSAQLYQLAATGFVTPQLVADMREVTLVRVTNSASSWLMGRLEPVLVVLAFLSFRLWWH